LPWLLSGVCEQLCDGVTQLKGSGTEVKSLVLSGPEATRFPQTLL